MNRIFIPLFLFCAIFFLSPQLATAITIDTVPVGNPGNSPDQNFFGQGQFRGRCLIATASARPRSPTRSTRRSSTLRPRAIRWAFTTSTWAALLFGGITRSGSDGSYSYATILGHDNMPVNWVSWYDAIRFANWLNNGQGNGDTETGAYTLGRIGRRWRPLNGNEHHPQRRR